MTNKNYRPGKTGPLAQTLFVRLFGLDGSPGPYSFRPFHLFLAQTLSLWNCLFFISFCKSKRRSLAISLLYKLLEKPKNSIYLHLSSPNLSSIFSASDSDFSFRTVRVQSGNWNVLSISFFFFFGIVIYVMDGLKYIFLCNFSNNYVILIYVACKVLIFDCGFCFYCFLGGLWFGICNFIATSFRGITMWL